MPISTTDNPTSTTISKGLEVETLNPVSDLRSIDLTNLNLSQFTDNLARTKIDYDKIPEDLTSQNRTFADESLDLSSLDLSKLDFSKIPENFSLSNIDLSKISSDINSGKLDLGDLVENLGSVDLSTLDLSQIPENFSLANVDLSDPNIAQLAQSFGIESANLSQIDLSNIDLSMLLSQFAPSDSSYYDFGDYEEFEIGEYDDGQGNSGFDYQESLPVTENEADKKLVEELGISQLVKMAGSFSFKSSR